MSIFVEAHFWDKLHQEEFVTPNEVLGILHQREVLRVVRDRVMVLVSAYNTFTKHLKGTSKLYMDHLKILDKKLHPGLKKIPWSMRPIVIDKFVQVSLRIYSLRREMILLNIIPHGFEGDVVDGEWFPSKC
jgi:dynein heavy chain